MLKIDLAKAFDMVEWSVVLDALQHKGFHSQFLELVHACISTMSYSVNVNGDSYGLVEASGKDVRFLHIFLSLLLMSSLRLHDAMDNAALTGIYLGPGCPQFIRSFLLMILSFVQRLTSNRCKQ